MGLQLEKWKVQTRVHRLELMMDFVTESWRGMMTV
jgi:hypothetical protein